jgi:hypothetical protein
MSSLYKEGGKYHAGMILSGNKRREIETGRDMLFTVPPQGLSVAIRLGFKTPSYEKTGNL